MTGPSIKSPEIKNAFLKIKRENFVPQNMKEHAYEDRPLPIGFGQTISQPSTIGIMFELLGAKKGDKILEVGSGCGYACALLSTIAGENG